VNDVSNAGKLKYNIRGLGVAGWVHASTVAEAAEKAVHLSSVDEDSIYVWERGNGIDSGVDVPAPMTDAQIAVALEEATSL
jgi:hypothetical protein